MNIQTQLPTLETNDRKSRSACVGVFHTAERAFHAVKALRGSGIQDDWISVFTPGPPRQSLSSVETSDTEQGGMGAAMAGSILGALGLGIGVILFVPVVGAVSVLGAVAAGLMGAGGAAAGAAVGSMLERKSFEGLIPVDEIHVYEDALAQGRSIVFVTPDEGFAVETMGILKDAGAESIDAARESWWVGLRDGRKLKYDAPEQAALWDDPLCLEGFEAALRHDAVGKTEVEGRAELAEQRPTVTEERAFWFGYSEGRAYARSRKVQEQPAESKN